MIAAKVFFISLYYNNSRPIKTNNTAFKICQQVPKIYQYTQQLRQIS
jgi:hypothetical protein